MKLIRTANGNYYSPDDPYGMSYTKADPRLSVTDEEGEILSRLAEGHKVLEIGTGLGVSTRALAKTARYVFSVDIEPWCHSEQFPDNVVLSDKLPEALEIFDLVFIDGSHSYADTLKDIQATADISPVILHDVYIKDVEKAAQDAGLILITQYETVCKLTVYQRNHNGRKRTAGW